MNLIEFQLLTDENIDPSVVEFLRPGHFFPARTVQALQRLFVQAQLDCIPPFILVIEDKTTHIKIRLRNSV